ncbi:hypothetical protein BDV39DRAFT_168716 [Aspergillus sergii]|uniref:Uncharacterized protein n=1 Tax=Aspergillus sergii TaxID=1034303 RepID=A0A5N6XG56_9EURO|nr:hypothetical protein BDV39DRAFT_168716 [Aspergillus sergii]
MDSPKSDSQTNHLKRSQVHLRIKMGDHLWQRHALWLPVASSACWLLMFSTILHSGTNMPFVPTQRHPLRRHLLRPVDVCRCPSFRHVSGESETFVADAPVDCSIESCRDWLWHFLAQHCGSAASIVHGGVDQIRGPDYSTH